MKKLLTLILAAALALSLVACGGDSGARDTNTPSTGNEDTTSTDTPSGGGEDNTPPVNEETIPPEEPAETPSEVEPTNIAIGETVSLDFVEMTFEEFGIAADIQQSITTDISVGTHTRITGPQPEEGKQFVYLRGTIKNLDTNALPVYDFFAGKFNIDKYNFEVDANNCDIITTNGEPMSMIDPLVSGVFTIYAAIPNELAESHSTTDFTFGFYDLFDNSELARNRAFLDNPITECPYQYVINID